MSHCPIANKGGNDLCSPNGGFLSLSYPIRITILLHRCMCIVIIELSLMFSLFSQRFRIAKPLSWIQHPVTSRNIFASKIYYWYCRTCFSRLLFASCLSLFWIWMVWVGSIWFLLDWRFSSNKRWIIKSRDFMSSIYVYSLITSTIFFPT